MIITYGAQLRGALTAAERLSAEKVSAVLDLSALKPRYGSNPVECRHTSKALVVHSANQLAVWVPSRGMIAARFEWLDAPVMRLAGLDTPVPFSPPPEDAYRPNAQKIYDAAKALAHY